MDNKQTAQTENLTFPLMNGKRETIHYIHPDEAKNPLQLIGNLIKQFAGVVIFFADFPNKHLPVMIPATGSYGEKERALRAHKNYLQVIMAGIERDEQVKDKKTVETLKLYAAKGWKFKTFTKIGVLTVANEKVKEVTTSVRLVKEFTLACPELKQLVANNVLRAQIATEIRANGIDAGLKLAKEKSYKALPAIVS